jgi:hypothetical protein
MPSDTRPEVDDVDPTDKADSCVTSQNIDTLEFVETKVNDEQDNDSFSEDVHSPHPSDTYTAYRGVKITFEDASDAVLLHGILCALVDVACVGLVCLTLQLSVRAGGPTTVLQRVGQIVMLDLVSVTFILIGFGAVYLSVISPEGVFGEIAQIFFLGLMTDNVVGALLTCCISPLVDMLLDRFDGGRVGVTVLEAILNTHVCTRLLPRNINPAMWMHYAMTGLAVLSFWCTPPVPVSLHGSQQARREASRRCLLASLATLVLAHTALCLAMTSEYWFFAVVTTAPLRICEALGGGLFAYFVLQDPASSRLWARQWCVLLQAPLLTLTVACWAHEIGMPAEHVPTRRCLSVDSLTSCLSPGILAVPRSWAVALALLARAMSSVSQSEEVSSDDDLMEHASLDLQDHTQATKNVIDMLHQATVFMPAIALGWPILMTGEALLFVLSLHGPIAGNGVVLVFGPFIVVFMLKLYTHYIRPKVSVTLMSGGLQVCSAMHFARVRLCCAH